MSILFWGLTISVVGKIFLVVGILMAHGQIAHEHRIDQKVLRTFHTEKILTIVGLILIVFGYALEIYFYGFTDFLTCTGEACNAAVSAALSQ